MGVGGSKETLLEARGEPVEIKMVEDASNDLQLAMGAKQGVQEAVEGQESFSC